MELVNLSAVLDEVGEALVSRGRMELGVMRPRQTRRTTWAKAGNGWQPKQTQVRKGAASPINATGALRDSLKSEVKEGSYVTLKGLDYGDTINDGRPPTSAGGNGAVFRAIKQWTLDKNVRPQTFSPQGARFSKYKSADINQNVRNAQAFLISRSIHTFGIKARPWLDDTLTAVYDKYTDKIGNAVAKDLADEIRSKTS
jgi:hypothetical protein